MTNKTVYLILTLLLTLSVVFWIWMFQSPQSSNSDLQSPETALQSADTVSGALGSATEDHNSASEPASPDHAASNSPERADTDNNIQYADEEILEITMYRGQGCQCCVRWADYLEENGFKVTDALVDDLIEVKVERQVPSELASCHTAVIDGYVVEGHVPSDEIRKLVEEQPDAIGISVPGMPVGSPGMEGMISESYSVILFDEAGNWRVYARY